MLIHLIKDQYMFIKVNILQATIAILCRFTYIEQAMTWSW